jgi:hypothetical protein
MDNKDIEFDVMIGDIKSLIEVASVTNSQIFYSDHSIDEFGTKTVKLRGGLNGNGEWTDYFDGLSRTFKCLKNNGYDTWLININNDVIDDVFYATIGVEKKK